MTGRLALSFTELEVYQTARNLSRDLFEITRAFPRDETYALTGQLRRASRSIGAQIAEAWAKKRYHRHFVSKLTDADAEQLEAQHWIGVAMDCGYLGSEEAEALTGQLAAVGRMLNSMMEKARLFCEETGHSSES